MTGNLSKKNEEMNTVAKAFKESITEKFQYLIPNVRIMKYVIVRLNDRAFL